MVDYLPNNVLSSNLSTVPSKGKTERKELKEGRMGGREREKERGREGRKEGGR
jgi:hypothetical protein